MIVKDEAHIIVNTLTNLTKYIQFDYWVISDTGSTDTTKELIKGFFMSKNIPGELIETPWKDFGYNRSVALEKAYNKTDYAFVFDADDEIVGDFLLPDPLDKDVYSCQYGNKDGIRLTRPQLFNNRKRWKYVGVLHEYLESIDPTEKSVVHKGNYYFTLGEQGNRSKDSNKYLKDASVLEAAFYNTQNDTNKYLHSRYAYYCAQSYAGANNKEKALEFYKKTLKLEGWLEEKYVSCIRIFDMLPNKDEGIPYLIEASKYNKKRIECILRLVRHYSLKNMASKSYEYYKLIQNFFENDFYNNGITEHCLCINIAEYKFFLPYSMIIISDRVKDYKTGIKMYEIIFKYSYVTVDKFYITNLISNLKFFYKHVTDPQFFTNMRKYIDLLRSKKFTIDEALVKTYTLNINSLVVKENITQRPTICFIILTCEKYINTRLKWQLKTSLKEVPKKDIYAISCKMGKESYIYGWNTADDYDSLAMKYYMFIKNMDIHYDYYMFIDDDTFIFPSRVISWLSQYDKKVPYYMGCKLEYPVNITMSGGAGFILSNPAYKALRKHVSSLQEFNGILADRTMADWLNHIYYNNQTSKLTYICDNVFFNSCRRGDLLTCGTQHYLKEEQDYIDLYNIYTNKESKDLVIAILAKDKGFSLPLYLECIYKQTYPKSHTHLYIRTNDNKDNTVDILKQFIKDHESEYASVYFDDTSIDESLKKYKHHEWNSHRCKILGKIRQDSIDYAKQRNAHYFVADCDNFIVPETISELLKNSENGIIAPMLNSNRDGDVAYSNYHYDIDKNGYLKKHDLYTKLLYRNIKGLIEVPVVHCTYFINNEFLNDIVYDDESYRYEYVIFSDVLRNKNIPQILDNRQFYGIIEFSQTGEELKTQFETVWKSNSIYKTYNEVQNASNLTMQICTNRNFLFTSAGDNTNFDSLWINDAMDYDVYVIYYGDNEEIFNRYKSKVKFIEKRKGSKFQNFKYFYDTYPAIINTYDRFFILDDDIIFNVEDITNMFKLSRDYKLDICGPSFSTRGYISHKITEHKPDTILTYTNFVEVNVPLFSKKALDKLMGILDYSLIGWGIDYLYMWCNGIDRQTSYAIIHSIQCINPNNCNKLIDRREIEMISTTTERENLWLDFSKKMNIPSSFNHLQYSSIKQLESTTLNRNFVFTSAGDNTKFDSLWIDDAIDYDIYVIYYGDNEEIFNRYKSKVKFIEKRKGSKFQNFKYFYHTYPEIINIYDRFFILDDDIIFKVEDITNMFKLSRQYKLDICAPSFSTRGYISHKITEHKPDTILTYTNFVEVNTPLFSKNALDKLMYILDYSLIAWGIDYLYIWCNGINEQKSYAIIHSIQCINPHTHDKIAKVNELDKVNGSKDNATLWLRFSRKINCPQKFTQVEYSNVKETMEINKKYSVVILNFNRPNHTKKTLDKLVTYGAIDTIIVSNGNIENAVEYEHKKVIVKNDAGINNLHGLDRRFLRALDSNTDDIIIIDDDIQIEEAELYKILYEYEKNTLRIVGSSGRRNGSDNNYKMSDIYGRVDTVLTKLLVCKTKLAYLFFYCKPLVEHIYKTGIPYGNGEDIFFSFLTNLLYDFKNYAVSGIRVIDSGNDCFAVSKGGSHFEYRSKLNKYVYSNKELFYKHIDKFRFPRLHEEPVVKIQILNKEPLDFLEQKSRNLVLTMSLGADRNFLDITEPYMKQYADKYGADFIVLDDDSYPILNYNKQLNRLNLKCGRNYGGNSYYLKILLIHYYLEYYDKILWLDDSCIVSPNTENIFDIVDDGSVGGCSIINDKAKPREFTFIKDRKGFDINTTQYINSGIVIYTKKTRPLFSLENIILNKELLDSGYPHQCYLNYMLQSNGISIKCLDNKYNDMFLHYDYLKIRNNLDTHIDTEYIRIHDTSIFHITGWWTKRQEVLKNIADILKYRKD